MALTRKRTKPGVLAYDGDEVVGWAAVAPRADLPFARSTKIPHVDDQPAWSVWCIRVRPGRRAVIPAGAAQAGPRAAWRIPVGVHVRDEDRAAATVLRADRLRAADSASLPRPNPFASSSAASRPIASSMPPPP